MRPPTPVPRVRDYLRILARYWIVIFCATALSAGAGWLARQSAHPQYAASTQVFVETAGGASVYDAYYGNRAAVVHAVSVQKLAKNPQVAKRTIDQVGLHQTPAELIDRITSVVHGALVDISVTGDTPELARDTANSVTFNLLALTDEVAALGNSDINVQMVNGVAGVSDLRAPLTRYLLLGGFLGLGLSAVLVIALGRVRDSVLAEEQVARIVDQTVAGGKA